MEIPQTIKIWGHNYKILKRKEPKYSIGNEVRSALGLFHANEHKIIVKSTMTPTQEIETLIHEILHGVFYYSNVNAHTDHDQKIEEHYVDTIANGITLILKDNPELLDYIKEKLTSS